MDRAAEIRELNRLSVDELVARTDGRMVVLETLDAVHQHLAESIAATGIVVITRRGRMANYVTNCHPFKSMVYAFTNDSRTRRQLALNRGVHAYRSNFSRDPEKTLALAFGILREREGLATHDKVVVISDILEGAGVEAIQVRELGNPVANLDRSAEVSR